MATLAVPGYLHPAWWARLTVLAGGAGGLVLGLIGCRRSIPVSWLFGMAAFGDLEIASCMTLADTDTRIAPVAFSPLSVMVALYGTRRMLAAQAGAAVLGCMALEVLPQASAIAVAQAVATAFAMIVPAFAVDAVRHRWERAVAVSQGQRDTTRATRAIAAAVHAVLDQNDRPGAIIDAAKTITQAQLISLLQPDDHGDLVCTASTAA
jgi:hypothetical protein